jgi:hypothetical protein
VYLPRDAQHDTAIASDFNTFNHGLQDSYWNYGAASAKWVPPEHRTRGRSGAAVPLHLAVKDACYTWDESPAAVR